MSYFVKMSKIKLFIFETSNSQTEITYIFNKNVNFKKKVLLKWLKKVN